MKILGECRLYLITPPRIDITDFSSKLSAALDGGDVACLQLRLKGSDDATIRRATETLMPICHSYNVPFLINDRADLAAELGTDGAHIGIDDGSYQSARTMVGDKAFIGVSCYDSKDRAMEAGQAGADYVAFGAFFDTQSKIPRAKATIELLQWWNEFTILQSVAIGGITAKNCKPLVKAGVDFLAVISAVWEYPEGPGMGVRALNDAIAEASAS